MKYPIKKNTVQETLVIPMYGRKMCSQLYPKIYRDETALRLIDQVDYDFSALEEKAKSIMHRFGFLEVAMRQSDLAWEVRDYLKTHPNAAVVNLGCGLDDTGRACDNGTCKIYNIDFPDVIAVRKTLVCTLAAAFPDGRIVFDAANRSAVKLMLKTWIRQAKIRDVGAYFAVADAKKELSTWSEKLSISSRGYMLGYQTLDDPSVSGFFRFLAKVGDGMMKMQIVRLDFQK